MMPFDAAGAYLLRNLDTCLPLLGALRYEPVRDLRVVAEQGALRGVALLVAPDPVPEALPSVMVAADSADQLPALLASAGWPRPATWITTRRAQVSALEQLLGQPHDPQRGAQYFVATQPPQRPHALVRRLALPDADTIDLAPCHLSPTALRNWIKRGWRVFGAVYEKMLLCHAMAAYPIGDTEEIAAVFTAPGARRQGFASAVVAATAADILAHGKRAVYVCKKTNRASQRVAEGLGMALLLETWELVTD